MKDIGKDLSVYVTCNTDSFGNAKHKFHDFNRRKT